MNPFDPATMPRAYAVHEEAAQSDAILTDQLPTDQTAPYLTRAEVRILALLSAQGLRDGWAAVAAEGGHVDSAQFNALETLLSLSIKLNALANDMKNGNTSGLFRTPF